MAITQGNPVMPMVPTRKTKTSLPCEFLPRIQQPEEPRTSITDEAADGAVLVYDREKGVVIALADEGMAKRLKEKRIDDAKKEEEKRKADEERADEAAKLAAKAPEPPKEAIAMPTHVVALTPAQAAALTPNVALATARTAANPVPEPSKKVTRSSARTGEPTPVKVTATHQRKAK